MFAIKVVLYTHTCPHACMHGVCAYFSSFCPGLLVVYYSINRYHEHKLLKYRKDLSVFTRDKLFNQFTLPIRFRLHGALCRIHSLLLLLTRCCCCCCYCDIFPYIGNHFIMVSLLPALHLNFLLGKSAQAFHKFNQ